VTYCTACAAALPGPAPVTCRRCGAQAFDNPRVCAGAIVTSGDRVLLLRRAIDPWRDHWDVPGGHCEPGEHPMETAVRETLEETGCPIEVHGFHGIWLDASAGSSAPPVVVYYLARPSGPEMPHGSEASERAWFPRDALPAPLAFPPHLETVLRAWREAS